MDKRTCTALLVFSAVVLQLATDVSAKDRSKAAAPTPPPVTTMSKKWCILKPNVLDNVMQDNINYVCSHGVDCKSINAGGACFNDNNLRSRASYAMNAYFRLNGSQDNTCYFNGSGAVVVTDPSNGPCLYL